MKTFAALILGLMVLATFAQAGEITQSLEKAMDASPDEFFGVWVYFQDKGLNPADIRLALTQGTHSLSEKALARRAKVYESGKSLDSRDLPLWTPYLAGVLSTGASARRQSRWFNAASFNATKAQVSTISDLPGVNRVDLVARFNRSMPTPFDGDLPEEAEQKAADSSRSWSLNYGGSIWAAELINVPPVHDMGLSGEGVVVGVLDAGFVLTHEAFSELPILAQWDFVHDDNNVQIQEGDHEWQNHHGGQVLSTIMGYSDGKLIGTAFGASAILAMTEDTGDETIVEEDNWVAAVEWVEGLGADIITSSLGYYFWYEYADLDGETAMITRAADMAVERGMAVFTSAGNERNNVDWPHLTAPADGDSVVAVGAVDYTGALAGFSSPGPTYDGRIKPDLCAMGVGTHVAAYWGDDLYSGANGTSFAAPQVAGIAALMLERLPQLTPMQIREALRQTGSQNSSPDNDKGWGVVDASAAIAYWGATINHTPLVDTENVTGPYLVTAEITDRVALDHGSLFLNWRLDGGAWQLTSLNHAGGDQFDGNIAGVLAGGQVEYYLVAGDINGYSMSAPLGGMVYPWSFQVGVDVVPPTLSHPSLTDQIPSLWPPVLRAYAEDNQGISGVEVSYELNGGMTQGPYSLLENNGVWELDFPLGAQSITPGDVVLYTIEVQDSAANPNVVTSGPHEMRILNSLGKVLIIDDLEIILVAKNDQGVGDDKNLTSDFELWLTEAGYEVQNVASGALTGILLEWADAAFLTSGNNYYPVGDTGMRDNLIAFAQNGGRILVEGGETAAACFYENQYLEFATNVLHSTQFQGDFVGPMTVPIQQRQHAFLNRPNYLPDILAQDMSPNPNDYGSSDLVLPDAESMAIYTSLNSAQLGGVILHDDNTGAEAGQVVFLTIDLGYLPEPQARPLLENCMAYLTGRESPGGSALSGTVNLVGSPDASGVLVSVDEEHFTTTGPDGSFYLSGLHGGTYILTASKDGYGTESITLELAADQTLSGMTLNLEPVVVLALQDTPALPIPDNNTSGLDREILVSTEGIIQSINVDMDISHPSIGQLVVSLTSPNGTTVQLHDHTGGISDNLIGNWPATLLVDGPGTLDDFLNESAQGVWTLHVADTGWGAMGTWNSWGLNLDVAMMPSAVEDDLPLVTRVLGNHPNPFNPRTTLMFELEREGLAEMAIYDLKGRLVKSFGATVWPAGRHELIWDGRNSQGMAQGSGIYFFRLRSHGVSQAFKMTLVR